MDGSKALASVDRDVETVLKKEQRDALELLAFGVSDVEVAKVVGVRRETVWRWRNHDEVFRAKLSERRANMVNDAAERLHGLLDHAVTAVQGAIVSRNPDPNLAMMLLKSVGVFEQARELGRSAQLGRDDHEDERDEDDELERQLGAIDSESVRQERRVARIEPEAGSN